MKKFAIALGIPTSFAGDSLLHTVQTIRKYDKGLLHSLEVYADRTPLSQELTAGLEKCNAKLDWTPGPGSFLKKARKLIANTDSDILILTQDDIVFEKNTIQAIADAFEKYPEVTMLGIRILPLPPETFFERSMTSMVRLVDKICTYWNNGDNYLSSSGRCLAFRTNHLKKMEIPEVVNGDMYLYLENMRKGGTFMRAENAKVYIRCPQSLKDQYGPSNRYQYSQPEMEKYFNRDLTEIYKVPFHVLLKAVMEELFTHPIDFIEYIGVFVLTRVLRRPAKEVMKTVWDADTSTKNVAKKS